MYERYGKRLLDIILSLAATIILAIPMGLVALWIKLDSPGPVFFKQRRVGKGKTYFNILKFRTMRGDTPHDVPTHLLKDADSYITGSGAFLRKTSLDELPQFINVLRSDIPLRILKTRPEFSEKSMGAFALPAKSSTNKEEAFSQVVSCFANGLRMRRIPVFNCKRFSSTVGQFLAKPDFRAVCA